MAAALLRPWNVRCLCAGRSTALFWKMPRLQMWRSFKLRNKAAAIPVELPAIFNPRGKRFNAHTKSKRATRKRTSQTHNGRRRRSQQHRQLSGIHTLGEEARCSLKGGSRVVGNVGSIGHGAIVPARNPPNKLE